jgi:hypothetical protein
MKHTPAPTVARILLRSAWQAVLLRSALTVLLLAPLAPLRAADAPKPAFKVTQQLLNSIHVTPKLIFDRFPAYAEKYLPFAMAASMEVTHKGRLWTCWAGGQDGPNAYLLASYSDDQGRSWRDLQCS